MQNKIKFKSVKLNYSKLEIICKLNREIVGVIRSSGGRCYEYHTESPQLFMSNSNASLVDKKVVEMQRSLYRA